MRDLPPPVGPTSIMPWRTTFEVVFDHGLDLRFKLWILGVRLLHARENVLNDSAKQQYVVLQKLGQVGVSNGPQHREVFILIGVARLEQASGVYDGVDGTHAKVVVVLRRELLRRKAEGGDKLLRARLGEVEPEGEESDLGDEGIIGHHHRHRPEERFQVVRKFGPPSVARIHSDKGRGGWVELDHRTLELEDLLLLNDCVLDV
eukprot:scaffold43252_cov28-Tisochrysis_lutea.AAC.4